MIDATTGRYCIVCSYRMHARGNDLLAIEGLPALSETQGRPLTDHLCAGHVALYSWAPRYLGTCDDRGVPYTYMNGVEQEHFLTMDRRPRHQEAYVFSQDDADTGLEYMERRLYVLLLELEARRHIWIHPGDVGEYEMLTAEEAVDRAGWRRWIKDALPKFLESERLRTPDDVAHSYPFFSSLGDNIDDPDDRISGEE